MPSSPRSRRCARMPSVSSFSRCSASTPIPACSEDPAYYAIPFVVASALAGTLCSAAAQYIVTVGAGHQVELTLAEILVDERAPPLATKVELAADLLDRLVRSRVLERRGPRNNVEVLQFAELVQDLVVNASGAIAALLARTQVRERNDGDRVR